MAHHQQNPSMPIFSNEAQLKQKIATLLNMIISFQSNIERLKIKLCGFPNFWPEPYFLYIDKGEKGHITSENMTSFIKKFKHTFNIDERYMRVMFKKFNNDQTNSNLSYFGYLNMIKPYNSQHLVSELLNRKPQHQNHTYDERILKIFHEMICMTYVSVAEHEQMKELIAEYQFMNIHEFMTIIMNTKLQNPRDEEPESDLPIVPNERKPFFSEQVIGNRAIVTEKKIQSENIIGNQRQFSGEYLPYIFKIIEANNFDIKRSDMRYLLAYLRCHQYMLIEEKYLTMLFMPNSTNFTAKPFKQSRIFTFQSNHETNSVKQRFEGAYKVGANFLSYVHPNSKRPLQQSFRKQSLHIQPEMPMKVNPQNNANLNPKLQYGDNSLSTPFLQKFLRESNVAKNMSIVKQRTTQRKVDYSNIDNESSSAFVDEPNFQEGTNQRKIFNKKPKQELNNNRNVSLHKLQVSQSIHEHDYLNNFSNKMKGASRKAQTYEENSNILSNFMIR